MLTKVCINLGTRNGYIQLATGTREKPAYKDLIIFDACNVEKPTLYNAYCVVEENIVKVLAYLTATHKTFIALVDLDKVMADLKNFQAEAPHRVVLFR